MSIRDGSSRSASRVAQRFNGNASARLRMILAENAQQLRTWGQEMRALLAIRN